MTTGPRLDPTTARPASVLHDRQFLRYLVARCLSLTGSLVTLVALPILVYRISGSASLTALVAACEAMPYLLFGLLAGALTDRWNRKRVMIAADVVSSALVLSLPVAHLLAEVTVPHVLAIAFLGPAVGVFFDGAVFGAVPTLVGRDRIAEANAYTWGISSVAEIVVPSLTGLALAVLHPSTLLLVDAVTFAVSAALIAGIVRPMHDASRERPPLTVGQLGRDVREGLDYLVRHAGVRTMTIIGFLQCAATGGFVALEVVWLDRHLGVGTEGLRFGVVFGSWAVGGLVAALLLPRVLRHVSPAWITLVSLPPAAVGALAIPPLEAWWLAAPALAVWSVFSSMVVMNSISYRQMVTPEHLLGRVNTAGRMLAWGFGWTGGAFAASALVGLLGTVATMETLALGFVVATVVAWTSPLRREPFRPD